MVFIFVVVEGHVGVEAHPWEYHELGFEALQENVS